MGSAFPFAFESYESLGPHSREEGRGVGRKAIGNGCVDVGDVCKGR